ncbi:MAG TPA: malto-oligosyltrehalose trehalohydrolase [Nitrospirales bacterium]|nr:malto-oligosyltrehalose trehalohydrolase [Nitrospirales bacterium]
MTTEDQWQLDLGARPFGASEVFFRVWAPFAQTVAVQTPGRHHDTFPLEKQDSWYFQGTISLSGPGTRYQYVLDGQKTRPDPASRSQPDGVHKPSEVVAIDGFPWTDHHWRGMPLERLILYELHTGTFTREGTFEAIIPFLDYLANEVGVTAIELMPVAQFPGTRNWGYDGVYPFAPHADYGGSQGLKRLVDACHARNLAVVLDVVYNHLGPEGNYLGDFGPYFTNRYPTPWGQAINYDGADSAQVRHYFISNALYWITEFHIDALRLDAIHGIFDFSVLHILEELTSAVHRVGEQLGRRVLVIAESDSNDARVIRPMQDGGYGLDAQWSDDFHHALHTLLTHETVGYYQDFGPIDDLATAFTDGFVYQGQASAFRKRRHGSSPDGCNASQFIICCQNHDQIGNRPGGDRLSTLIPDASLKVAAASVLLAPNIPLIFMGEEYGETAPFLYFVDHSDPHLQAAVRDGRQAEYKDFGWSETGHDPTTTNAFEHSRVHPGMQTDSRQQIMLRWYRQLIGLRKEIPALGASQGGMLRLWTFPEQVLIMHRWAIEGPQAIVVLGFNPAPTKIDICAPEGTWTRALDAPSEEGGDADQTSMPEELTIGVKSQSTPIPSFTATVYITTNSHP